MKGVLARVELPSWGHTKPCRSRKEEQSCLGFVASTFCCACGIGFCAVQGPDFSSGKQGAAGLPVRHGF